MPKGWVAASVTVLTLAGCAHSGLAPGRTGAQAAAVNVQLAIEYLKINKLAAARDTIERAMRQDPDNANVQSTAGLIYEHLNETAKAEKAYSTAAREGRNDPNIQNNYAGFLCRTGKTAAGEKLFAETARNPAYQTPEVALVNAGVCVEASGDLLDAERYFNKALTLRPNLPDALLQLGNLSMTSGDAARALGFAQRYLSVSPPTAEVLWLSYRAQRRLGDAAAAATAARRIQLEFPDSEQAQLMRSGTDR